MEAFFNAPLLYHLSWNPAEATGTPVSLGSGRRQTKKEDGLNLSPGDTPVPRNSIEVMRSLGAKSLRVGRETSSY